MDRKKDGSFLAQRYQFYLAQQGQTLSGAHDLLDSLIERDYNLYAATNGITAIQTGRLAQSGLAPYFNQVFISEQLQTQKPDALFYEKIGQQIAGFSKEKTLMIGDSLTADIQGGNNAGLTLSGIILITSKITHKPSRLTKSILTKTCWIV